MIFAIIGSGIITIISIVWSVAMIPLYMFPGSVSDISLLPYGTDAVMVNMIETARGIAWAIPPVTTALYWTAATISIIILEQTWKIVRFVIAMLRGA